MKKMIPVLMLSIALLGCSAETEKTKSVNIEIDTNRDITATPIASPNIVLILADDLALMDFGIYGGEAETPNIDALAASGTLFTNYHTSPMCAPSRAMLMTGKNSHATGVPNLPLFLPDEYQEKSGYEGVLNNDVQTVASRLKAKGYDTYITGKWHLGQSETTLPTKRGFDRSYILNASGADNYEHRPYLPGQGKPAWFKDGKPIDLPDGFYSSRSLVNEMIGFMDEKRVQNPETQDPFFAFLSFQAVHIPVQVPKEYTAKYIGTYSEGWDSLREKRFQKAKDLKLIPANSKLGNMHPALKDWAGLSSDEKKYASKAMAVNAGMIDAMDEHIGRYIDYLKANDQYDNTVFIITSDNGPEASTPAMVPGIVPWFESQGLSTDYETLGEKRSVTAIGPEFASAAAGPSAFFKFYAGEGGLRVPLIISGPGVTAGQKNTGFSFVTDITPSIVQMANVTPVVKEKDFDGRSLVPVLRGAATEVYGPDDVIGMEAAGQAALFKGQYKITRNNPPLGDSVWRLYDLSNDPGETQDLSNERRDIYTDMLADYDRFSKKNGVLEMPEGYEPLKEIMKKAAKAGASQGN